MKLNLGIGQKHIEGFVNCDLNDETDPDRRFDFMEHFPFEDNSISFIQSKHTIEHLQNITNFMNECYRILKPNGELVIDTVHISNVTALANPFHIKAYMPISFISFTKSSHNSYETKTCFEVIETKIKLRYLRFLEFLVNRHPCFFDTHLCQLLPAKTFEIRLTKVVK